MFDEEKEKIINICNRMIEKKLTISTGGNVSFYNRDKKTILITPSGIPYHLITKKMIIEMDDKGNILSEVKNITSEWRMHLEAYKARPDVNAMIHAHPLYSIVISTIYKNLPAIDYLMAFSGSHEVSVTNYKRFGTKEIAYESAKYLKNANAVILANHGINVISQSLERSFAILENLELCAEIYCKAKQLGEPKILPRKEITELLDAFSKYGVK